MQLCLCLQVKDKRAAASCVYMFIACDGTRKKLLRPASNEVNSCACGHSYWFSHDTMTHHTWSMCRLLSNRPCAERQSVVDAHARNHSCGTKPGERVFREMDAAHAMTAFR